MITGNQRNYQKIKKKYTLFEAVNQFVNSKKGTVLTETKDILNKWHEYVSSLFENTVVKDSPCPDLNVTNQESRGCSQTNKNLQSSRT